MTDGTDRTDRNATTDAPPPLRIEPVEGPALSDLLAPLAALRIAVFRDYPYLYDGDLAYERAYLDSYAVADGAIIVGAWDGDRLVGAATGAPLTGGLAEWAAPFRARGIDLDGVFYCGESVLLPAYRGRGAGHAFFDHREERARRLGKTLSAFCAVIRPDAHPARPADYRPLDPFWRKRGYAPEPGMEAAFDWKEVGDAEETPHRLQFWLRRL